MVKQLETDQTLPETNPTLPDPDLAETYDQPQNPIEAIEAHVQSGTDKIRLNESELETLEVQDINGYLAKITITCDDIFAALDFIQNNDLVSPIIGFNPNISDNSLTFWVASPSVQRIRIFAGTIPSMAVLDIGISTSPGFKILTTSQGAIPYQFSKINLQPIQYETRNPDEKPSERINFRSLQKNREIISGTEIATLNVDISSLSQREILNILWNDLNLRVYAANPSIIISFTPEGFLTISSTDERGESDLVLLAKSIKTKLPDARLLLESKTVQQHKGQNYTTKHNLEKIDHHTSYCIIADSIFKRLKEARMLHQIEIQLAETATGLFEVIEVSNKTKFNKTTMVGEPHLQSSQDLNDFLVNQDATSQLIVGKSGSGKTTVISRTLDNILNRNVLAASFSQIHTYIQGYGFVNICKQLFEQVIPFLSHLKPEHQLKVQKTLNDLISKGIIEAREDLQTYMQVLIKILKLVFKIYKKPIIVVIEDVHFADPLSKDKIQEFLNLVNENFSAEQIKIVLSTRPINEQNSPQRILNIDTKPIQVESIPFRKKSKKLTEAFFQNPIPQNLETEEVIHEKNVNEFVIGFINRELRQELPWLPERFKIKTENFYRLIRYSNGNPYEAESLIRIAVKQGMLFLNKKNHLDVNEQFLINTETNFAVNKSSSILSFDPINSPTNQIKLNQIQNLKPTAIKIVGLLGLTKKLSFQELKKIICSVLHLSESAFEEAFEELQRWDFIEITEDKFCSLTNPGLIAIGTTYLTDNYSLPSLAKQILELQDFTPSNELKLTLSLIIASGLKNSSNESEDFLHELIGLITNQLRISPSNEQAKIFYQAISKLPIVKIRLNELLKNRKSKQKSDDSVSLISKFFKFFQKSEEAPTQIEPSKIDELIVISTLCGLLATLTTRNSEDLESLEKEILPVLELKNAPEIYKVHSEEILHLLFFNYYLLNNLSGLEKILTKTQEIGFKQRHSHTVYYLFRLQNKKVTAKLLDEVLDTKKTIPYRDELVGISGYRAALMLLENPLHDLDTNSNDNKEKTELSRISLRIPFEMTRKKYESIAAEKRDSKEFYPLEKIETQDNVEILNRIKKLEELLAKSNSSPNDFHDFTKLWTLEQLIQERMLLLEHGTKTIERITVDNDIEPDELLETILNDFDELVEFAINSNQLVTAVRALRMSSHLHWYKTHSLPFIFRSKKIENNNSQLTNPFQRHQKVLDRLYKAINLRQPTNKALNANFELVALDYIGFVATILNNIRKLDFSIEGFELIFDNIQRSIEIIELLQFHFGKKQKGELDSADTYEWGAIGVIIEFITKIIDSGEINITDEELDFPVTLTFDDNTFTINTRYEQTPKTINLNELRSLLEKISQTNLDQETISKALETTQQLESSSGIVRAYKRGLENLKRLFK